MFEPTTMLGVFDSNIIATSYISFWVPLLFHVGMSPTWNWVHATNIQTTMKTFPLYFGLQSSFFAQLVHWRPWYSVAQKWASCTYSSLMTNVWHTFFINVLGPTTILAFFFFSCFDHPSSIFVGGSPTSIFHHHQCHFSRSIDMPLWCGWNPLKR